MPDLQDYDGFFKVCRLCRWYAEDTERCVNDESDWLGDCTLPNNVCTQWEEKNAGQGTSDKRT